MAKKSKSKILIVIDLLLLLASFFLFKKVLGQTILIFPWQNLFSVQSWQHMPDGTQLATGIIGTILLIIGIVKLK